MTAISPPDIQLTRELFTLPREKSLGIVASSLVGDCSQTDLLFLIRTLLVLGATEQAKSLFSRIDHDLLDQAGQRPLLQAVSVRLGQPTAWDNRPPANDDYRWIRFLAKKGVDISYPTEPSVRDLLFQPDAPPQVLLEDRCPCCHNQCLFGPEKSQELHSGSGEWLCPHCLAQRIWEKTTVRRCLWIWYKAYLSGLPRQEGELTETGCQEAILAALALQPLAPVRFGSLCPAAIGHAIMNPSMYFFSLQQGQEPISLDIIGMPPSMTRLNSQLTTMWARHIDFSRDGERLASKVVGSPLMIESLASYDITRDPGLFNAPPSLVFTLTEERQAREELERMGVPHGAPFICLLVRDSAYDQIKYAGNPTFPPGCGEERYADIDSYEEACLFLAELGYYVIRTGFHVAKPLKWASKRIIDYSTKYRSELMDLWLPARCFFLFANVGGIGAMASIYRRPMLFTNHIFHYRPPVYSNTLVLFKHLRGKNSRRYKDLDYILDHIDDRLYNSNPDAVKWYSTMEWVNNSPQELKDAAMEMLSLIDGTWEQKYASLTEQASFWKMLEERYPGRGFLGVQTKISTNYLRMYLH